MMAPEGLIDSSADRKVRLESIIVGGTEMSNEDLLRTRLDMWFVSCPFIRRRVAPGIN